MPKRCPTGDGLIDTLPPPYKTPESTVDFSDCPLAHMLQDRVGRKKKFKAGTFKARA
jgi:hypothetical protein